MNKPAHRLRPAAPCPARDLVSACPALTLARRTLALATCALGAGGCLGDAERDSPFDPDSEDFQDEGAVRGVVTTFYAPFDGVPAARVHLIPLDTTLGPERVEGTDATGRYLFEEVLTGRYVLRGEAGGYASADTTLDVPLGRAPGDVTLRLDVLPRVGVQHLHTHAHYLLPPTHKHQDGRLI